MVYGTCKPFLITTSLEPYDNMNFERLDRFMCEPVEVSHWLLLIYESPRRFNPRSVDRMIADFVRACGAVGKIFQANSACRVHTNDLIGIRINPKPAVVRRESGQGIIARVSRLAPYPVDG